MGIGGSVGVVSAATAKHLALGQELSVNLQPDDSLVFHLSFSSAHFQIVYQPQRSVASLPALIGGYSTARVLGFRIIQFLEPPGWLNSGFRAASLERKRKPAGKKRPYAQV
jgi:hypothetical protein